MVAVVQREEQCGFVSLIRSVPWKTWNLPSLAPSRFANSLGALKPLSQKPMRKVLHRLGALHARKLQLCPGSCRQDVRVQFRKPCGRTHRFQARNDNVEHLQDCR
ncbi:hypothetical protein JB92DRAFT_2919096 [Gautieria morchelliformis]|nr:hypothetical protein JB92DRAFT_2919096 [Gautieria morchelliformis]